MPLLSPSAKKKQQKIGGVPWTWREPCSAPFLIR